jgi:hypothetical protein
LRRGLFGQSYTASATTCILLIVIVLDPFTGSLYTLISNNSHLILSLIVIVLFHPISGGTKSEPICTQSINTQMLSLSTLSQIISKETSFTTINGLSVGSVELSILHNN